MTHALADQESYCNEFKEKFGDFENGCYIGMTLVYGRLIRMSNKQKERLGDDVGDHIFAPTDSSSKLYIEGHQIADMYPVPNYLWRSMAERWDRNRVTTLNDLASFNATEDYFDESEVEEDEDGKIPYDDKKLDYEKMAVYNFFSNHPAEKQVPKETPYSHLVNKYSTTDEYDYYIVPNGF